MAYKALYRTYRPQSFSEVAGQEHITKTLQNALKNNKFTHAYLFSGPRGTGKTSVAKIIAKAVNCVHAPTSEPCNECDICKGITDSSISDIIEIDAASNNGVDEIREIRDKVKYTPSAGKFKVYIIDEVHMLSTGAFNALLKTLEEPPRHVIFILATTEPHKIPSTIISRCQRFDFRSISQRDIVDRMKVIVKEENIKISNQAMQVIAQNAHGGLRDALSILDQAISYADDEITVDDVHAITGSVNKEILLELTKAIHLGNTADAIKFVDELLTLGKEPHRLLENLILYYRDILLIKNVEYLEDEYLLFDTDDELKDFTRKMTNSEVYSNISTFSEAQYEMKWNNYPRVFIELAIVKASNRKKDNVNNGSIQEEILERIERLENSNNKVIKTKKEQENSQEVNMQLKVDNNHKTNTNSKVTSKLNETKKVTSYSKITSKDILDVLLNAQKEVRKTLQDSWKDNLRTSIFDIDVMQYRDALLRGTPVACSSNKIIIVFEDALEAARMLNSNISEKVKTVLQIAFNHKWDYISLPKDIWEEKSKEYITCLREKREPKLSELVGFPTEEEMNYYIDEEPIISDAIDLFGNDIIKVKD